MELGASCMWEDTRESCHSHEHKEILDLFSQSYGNSSPASSGCWEQDDMMINPHGQPLSLGLLGRTLPGEQPGLGAKDIKAQGNDKPYLL